MPELKENKNLERRVFKSPVTVEKREDGTIKSIVGYPIVYDKDSEDMGFIETIAKGAAGNALGRSDIRGLKNHDPSLIFARDGVNLRLYEDDTGIRYEATPIDTHNFIETAKEIELGLLDGQSFGFTIKSDEWSDLDKDTHRRTITEIDIIYDVGPVTFPAYSDTTVALRSLTDIKQDAVTSAKDLATKAQAEGRNLDADILILSRTEGGLKR